MNSPSAKGLEKIKSIFNLSENEINEFNTETTNFVNKYLTTDNDEWTKHTFSYINKLDTDDIKTYASYGADKAYVRDIKRFLNKFNLTVNDVKNNVIADIDQTNKLPKYSREAEILKRPTFVSSDKKLVITVSNPTFYNNGYFHYLGVTGDYEAVYEFVYFFTKLGNCDGSCYGGRHYI